MSSPDRNAVIWYADDGYAPETKGVNGRRVAGASFLKGFFRHADVDEFVSLTQGDKGKAAFAARLNDTRADRPHRGVYTHAPLKMAPVGTLYYPAPNYAEQCWLRQRYGMAAYAICGVTHTTATRAVMQGMFDLRASPQAPWDAVICTSRAVHAATSANLDLADEHLRQRFGRVPPRPLMPVIPLGINCDDFAHDAQAAATLRARMGLNETDIVVATLSRLIPYGKFDPGPLFLALQRAQERLGGARKLHFIACGIYGDNHSERVFTGCARALMPDVSYTHLDGADATARREALSGADIFTFPIDNIQETFGLAPIEAMAAGLPVVTSDWDGMRDTVPEHVGIRVPTLTGSGAHSTPEAWRYHNGRNSYAQYSGNVSALTVLDIGTMADAFHDLALNDDRRRIMGRAALDHATTHYDWAAIIPRMQDLWAEQTAMRQRATGNMRGPVPMAPSPLAMFSAYPGGQIAAGAGRFIATDSPHDVAGIFAARRYAKLGQVFESQARIEAVYTALEACGTAGETSANIAKQTGLHPIAVERACLFLMKYGLARHDEGDG